VLFGGVLLGELVLWHLLLLVSSAELSVRPLIRSGAE
jgi:hypothetical protein